MTIPDTIEHARERAAEILDEAVRAAVQHAIEVHLAFGEIEADPDTKQYDQILDVFTARVCNL